MRNVQLPVGVSDFAEIRRNGYYYVDKSGLAAELVEMSAAKVTLITRPRRFGKTLGMSMLSHFFDIREDSRELFEGLEISQNAELCGAWMNCWPTLFLSFRTVDGLNFQSAYEMLVSVIAEAYKEHLYLLESDKINDFDKEIFRRLVRKTATQEEIKNSLGLLIRVMTEHYGRQVILLMDEYDVPVAKANANHYYNEMLDVMKGILQALKDNTCLRLAVVTGCLKIAKESIFTGTNNFVSDTITASRLNEYFGFTQKDVDRLLAELGEEAHAGEIREWYDGYRFGDFDVYCPWDVMNYLRDLQGNPKARPEGYWKNTSDNAIIRSFIDHSGSSITRKMETLLAGGSVFQKVEEELTYDYLHASEDNLWSILYLTGYLTCAGEREGEERLKDGVYALKIPNLEIREIFETTVMKWFDESAKTWNRERLFAAVWSGDDGIVTEEMNRLLRKTISYHDYREDFYHAFLAGIFAGAGYAVESNREHGEGRSDLVVFDTARGYAAVFEIKYARAVEELETSCQAALRQMGRREYAEDFMDTYGHVLSYGVSFFRKKCLVKRAGGV